MKSKASIFKRTLTSSRQIRSQNGSQRAPLLV
jgi:hypothetical protein